MHDEFPLQYIFRCEKCESILDLDLSDSDNLEKDLEKIQNDKIILECQCGGLCFILRN